MKSESSMYSTNTKDSQGNKKGESKKYMIKGNLIDN